MRVTAAIRQKLLVESAIGTAYEMPDESDEIASLLFAGAIDAYCVKCKSMSVFKVEGPSYPTDRQQAVSNLPRHGVVNVIASCQRSSSLMAEYSCNEQFLVCFRKDDKQLTKIGQFPSRADLDFGNLDAAFGELEPQFRAELGRAIGLRAHGIGIGSFVYLRRIFEGLLEQAHRAAITRSAWNEEEYIKARVHERIKLLNDFLPSRLVQSAHIYGILSKGIHELAETECLELFDAVKQAIHFILAERHEQKEYERTLQEINAARSKLDAAGMRQQPQQ